MNSSPARGSFTTSSQQSARSLLSRIKSPLQSKARNFTDFYIQPDDPHRQYTPGDIISGSVILKVVKPLRITHLVISLHGFAQVFKNPNSPGDSYKNYATTIGSGKGTKGTPKGGSYFGNGFASLFDDEAVLCGEGRLGEGVYHFNFELEFPAKGLPSSIDFERGTISYMLTSTLTRPTTISPTTSCEAKVCVMDSIDIAPVPEPKPRIISLEPITRRVKGKSTARRRTRVNETGQLSSEAGESMRSGRVGDLSTLGEDGDLPQSPAPSDVSFESQLSSGAGSGTEYGIRSINTTEGTLSTAQGSKTTLSKGKTITATIEVLKGGFLRGDQIPIKITVKHTKHVRSLKGIIMTLYRQARVDMHPALPVGPNPSGGKAKAEDYYPRSKTGLGGLSLSSAGSSHLFRKDLSQSFAPLFVDPRTLTAEIKAAVRVPDEAFPTISNVPGAMISFRYFVEVVVDVQGKLSGLDRVFPNAGLINVPTYDGGAGVGIQEGGGANLFSTWGGTFADTDSIRREKGVISCLFEVVVGTKDSERNGKRRQQAPQPDFGGQDVHEIPLGPDEAAQYPEGGDPAYYQYGDDHYYDHYAYDHAYGDGYYDPTYYDDPQPAYIPPPEPESEEGLSEKERIRRAEARLLPSQPPSAAGPSSPSSTVHVGLPPSAPILEEDDDTHLPYTTTPSSSTAPHPIPPASGPQTPDPSQPSSAPSTIIAGESNSIRPLPHFPPSSPAPRYAPPASDSCHVPPTDDKHELQRRRLELERSAPPSDDPEDVAGPSHPPVTGMGDLTLAPSAPVINEDDEGERSTVVLQRFPSSAETRLDRRAATGNEVEDVGGAGLPPYER